MIRIQNMILKTSQSSKILFLKCIENIQFHQFQTGCCHQKKISNNAKENILKKVNKENKLIFGALLETQRQRKKRLIDQGILENEETKVISPQLKSSSNSSNVPNKSSDKKVILKPSITKLKSNHILETSNKLKDYHNVDLADLLKKDFPFENPTKPFCSLSSVASLWLETKKVEDSNNGYYPAVTSILSATMPTQARKALDRWRQNKIASLGMDGFLALNKATLQKGRDFHVAIQKFLTEQMVDVEATLPQDIQNCLKSVENVISSISKVHVIEGAVKHKVLKYKGYVDCICDIGGIPNVAIEWKKSENKKSKIELTYDAPLQLTAYMGAANYDDSFTSQILTGAVVVVNEDGSPASVFYLTKDNVAQYWSQWYKRYQQFNEQEQIQI